MMYRPGGLLLRRLAIRVLIALAVILVLAVVGLAALNLVLQRSLPRVERVARANGLEVQIDRLSFVPFRGFTARGVTVATPSREVVAELEAVRLRTTLAFVVRLRSFLQAGDALQPGQTAGAGASGRLLWDTAETLAAAELLPASLTVRGGTLRVARNPLAARAGMELAIRTASLSHRPGQELLLATLESAPVVTDTPGPSGRDASPRPSGQSAPRLSLEVRLSYAERIARADLTVDGLRVSRPAVSAEGRADLRLRSDLDRWYRVSGLVAARGLTVRAPAIAGESVGPVELSYEFRAELLPREPMRPVLAGGSSYPMREVPPGRLTVSRGTLEVNGVELELAPVIRGTSGLLAGLGSHAARDELLATPRSVELRVALPPTPVDRIARAVPQALQGPLVRLAMDGTLAWDLDLRVDLDRIGEMRWESGVDLEAFRVARIPAEANPYELNGSFVHVIEDPQVEYRRVVRLPPADPPSLAWMLEHSEHTRSQILRWREADRRIAAGVAADPPQPVPATPHDEPVPDPAYRYVRLEEMSPWVIRAVLTAEDGDFFFYHGVNFYTLPRALERNVRAGEIQFGASTISMQLVKMLFLDQDRILSRKLQEVFLVYLMEQEVPVAKSRILELYLNVVEFGPGVFGIADAARYYFNRDPADLSAGEATWLASILPAPKRYHDYYEAGAISPGWFERMKGLYDIMLERGRMTEDEYARAVQAPPRFARSSGRSD